MSLKGATRSTAIAHSRWRVRLVIQLTRFDTRAEQLLRQDRNTGYAFYNRRGPIASMPAGAASNRFGRRNC